MSIAITNPFDQSGKTVLILTKGADFIILKNLEKDIPQPFLTATQDDLNKFSLKGLRTLCYAVRVIERESYIEWEKQYTDAKIKVDEKQQKFLED